MMKKIICFIILLLPCCNNTPRKNTELPQLQLPWKITKFQKLQRQDFAKTLEGEWDYNLRLAKLLLEQGQLRLYDSTVMIYHLLLASQRSILLPLIVDPQMQRAMIEQAIADKIFLHYELSPQQTQKFNEMWQELVRADYYFILSGVLIAEMRQKTEQLNENFMNNVRTALEKLPLIARLEEKRQEVEKLRQVCRQLISSNSQLIPSSWEIIYEQDTQSKIIIFK